VFINQRHTGYVSNCRNSSIYIPSSRLHLHSLFFLYQTHRQHPELSRHHVTCTQHRFSFQNPPNITHNCVRSLWPSFRCVQLYHNANASDIDSFSTHSNGTKEQPQRKREGNCDGKNADIGYKSTPVVGSGPYKEIYLGTYLWTHTDMQCLRRQGFEGLGPIS